MQWTDDAIVLGVRRHGESAAILELFTREHGRHFGLARGARSPRHAAALQPGNSVRATWTARLDEQLGRFQTEVTQHRAARLIGHPVGLFGVQHVAWLIRLLAEREPHGDLFNAVEVIVDALDAPPMAAELLVQLEMAILEALGFGLDLGQCALTGRNDDLAYISPRTGRAATRSAGEAYADRLLPLPRFLVDRRPFDPPTAADIAAGFRLTGHFLDRHVLTPRGIANPDVRDGLISALARALDPPSLAGGLRP
jgi:DNA repair protein RecO (recombination protein O)